MSESPKVTAIHGAGRFGVPSILLLMLLGAAILAWSLLYRSPPPPADSNTIYVIDASARMLLPFGGDSTRLEAARNLVNELVRGASPTTASGVRLFGSGAIEQPCDDTTLLVPLATNNQPEIAQKLGSLQAGPAESALTLAIATTIRDLRLLNRDGRRLLVLVTGGEDTCAGERSHFIAEELDRANIDLETIVIDFAASQRSAQALRVLVADLGGGTYVEVDDEARLDEITEALQDYFRDFEDGAIAVVGEPVAAVTPATGAATASPATRTTTATPTPSVSPSPETPTATDVPGAATPSATPSATATPGAGTVTPITSPTATASPTATVTTTTTVTVTPSPTITATMTTTATATATITLTATATATLTPLPPPPDDTPTPTATVPPPTGELVVDGNCTDDDGDGRCDGGVTFKTIQAAIGAAAGGDTITVITTGTHTEAGIEVNKSVTIVGNVAGGAIVQAAETPGGANAPVFTVTAGNTVTLQAMTIQHGQPGIVNDGALTLNGTAVRNNGPFAAGAGILNNGALTINDSTIAGNQGSSGGGLFNAGGTVTIHRSTISNNTADPDGGGIFASGGVTTINNSTITQNVAAFSGGGLVTSAGVDGSEVIINNSTIVNNSAGFGGGIQQWLGAVTISNSIVANNTGGDCGGAITSAGYNQSSDATCAFTNSGDQQNTAPQLTPLQNNGGPTLTHAPLLNSPAIDAGNPPDGGGVACRPGDQRGQVRPLDGNGDSVAVCDIGAVEIVFTAPALPVTAQEITIQEVTVNGGGQIAQVAPGAPVDVAVTFFIQDTICPTCIDQILIGLADERAFNAAVGCVFDGVPGAGGISGSGNVAFAAPALPGNYAIRFRQTQALSCDLGWWNVDFTPGRDRNVGFIRVVN